MPSGDFDSSSFDLHNNLVKVTTIIASLIMQSLLHTGPCWVPIARPEGSALAWVSLVNLVSLGGGGAEGTHRIVFKCLSRPFLLTQQLSPLAGVRWERLPKGALAGWAKERGERWDLHACSERTSQNHEDIRAPMWDSRWSRFEVGGLREDRCLNPRKWPRLGFLPARLHVPDTNRALDPRSWVGAITPFYG